MPDRQEPVADHVHRGAALKTSTFVTTTLVAGSFFGFIGLVIYLAATDVVTRQMAILLGVALSARPQWNVARYPGQISSRQMKT